MTPVQHTLAWGTVVKTRHGDAVASWPRPVRQACSAAMERSKQYLRDKEGPLKFVSQTSSCNEHPGGYHLVLQVVVEMTGHDRPEGS